MDKKRRSSSMQRRVEYIDKTNNKRYSREKIRQDVRQNIGDSNSNDNKSFKRKSEFSSETNKSIQESSSRNRRPMTEAERRRKMELMRKRQRLRKQRIHAVVVMFVLVMSVVVLLFMTPIFNIDQINLEGNRIVTKEQIQSQVGDLIGKNLFSTTKSKIRQKVMQLPQIEDVDVSKSMFPPSVSLVIYESSPAAYLLSGNKIVVINSELKVIDDSNAFDTDTIPSISGISIPTYKLNEPIVSDSAEKDDVLKKMLNSFETTGLLSSISYISLDDLSDIKFNYLNKIEAKCGSQLEIERKIRMFSAVLTSDSIDDNVMGTIDLSVPGNAVLNR